EEYGASSYSYNNDAFHYLYGPGNTWHRFRNSDFEDIVVFRSSKESYFYGYVSFLAGSSGASSIRYKKNIQNIDYEILKEILNINAKSYILKCNNTKNIGIIAEDIYDSCKNLRDYILHYELVENIIKENDNKNVQLDEKYKFTKDNKEYIVDGIKYQNITVILLEIVKNQQNEIDKLKNQITQLENQINNILVNKK